MVGSWLGYTFGLLSFWRSEVRRTQVYAKQYPKLMEHALNSQFTPWVGSRIDKPFNEWLCAGGMGRLSWAVLAAQSCASAVQELQENERQRLIDGYKLADEDDGAP
eukprot:CAMPEP_0183510820 /NCGR_PEP_ID=MMETSP0371-20130417/10530_1 /TAXON_ID=268820 /ORGANISM="Peridinium aciculiferum, Strain PAER-2" /LENGTH=105 /DNA_ID=CAMNT_0025707673 /DNA_START=165 /DNA_END=482 /DNA_ORIENTATION=-